MRNAKPILALLMGIIILAADLYWLYTSYQGWGTYSVIWTALGIVIFLADLAWLYLDWDMSRKP